MKPLFLLAAWLALDAPALADPALPDAIAAPGETALVKLHAVGAQIYECKPDAGDKLGWTFREPIATLIANGETVGRHYAGPTWVLDAGDVVIGKAVAHTPGATTDDIAWLKLKAVAVIAEGQFKGATTIQRINTSGGAATGGCDKQGAWLAVPYSADYVFLK